MDGVLVVDKPEGPTSHDVVQKIRRALKEKKIGHTGTLDPMATGVLPLVIGRATKLAQYLTGGDKIYRATIGLGKTTQTLDAEGETVAERPVSVTLEQLNEVLAKFRGEIEQIPPMYSAKKIDGQKLYTLARKGIEVEREAKKVKVHRLDLLEFTSPDVVIEVHCSAGTYVRVLAADIGELLGCGGHLKALRRLTAGPFSIEEAISLDAAIEDPSKALQRLLPVSKALSGLRRVDVPRDVAKLIASGYQLTVADVRNLDTPVFAPNDTLALGIDGGDVIAVVVAEIGSEELSRSRRDRRVLKTERVLVDRV